MSSAPTQGDLNPNNVPVSEECKKKFNPDGSPKYYPGISLLCHLRDDNPSHATLIGEMSKFLTSTVGKQPSHRYATLPRQSWHMTLLDCRLYSPDKTHFYDPGVARYWDMKRFKEDLHEMGSRFRHYFPIRMRVDLGRTPRLVNGRMIQIPVTGANDGQDRKIAALREALSNLLDVTLKDGYRFHITTHYQIEEMDSDDFSDLETVWDRELPGFAERVGEFEIDRLELCSFDDMTKFDVAAYVSADEGYKTPKDEHD